MKRSLLHISLCAFAASIGWSTAMAVPADPRPKHMTQPDGTVITVKLRGDEHYHYYLSEDNYLLARIGDTFYYADTDIDGNISASNLIANPIGKRSAAETAYLQKVDMQRVNTSLTSKMQKARKAPVSRGPGLFDYSFPSKGKTPVLVVLAEYADVKFTLPDPNTYFTNLLSKPGFSDYRATGSASDYFKDNSMGEFDPQFDLFGPVTLSHNMSYYGRNDPSTGSDVRAQDMIIEACQLLDPTVDFSKYDTDGDGFIDNVYVFYAGEGEASGGAPDTIWPHSWNIYWGAFEEIELDGVLLDRYACSNEWEGDRPDGIGTFVHEFSHVIGLPDLYSTDDTGTPFTPGNWDVMDTGTYNNDSRTPPNYSIYERYALDWITPTVLSGEADITLDEISTNQGCIIPSSDPNEFFLLENRQPVGWDTHIPGHGMLIWHIHYVPSVWTENAVNNKHSHQYVDLEEADNKRTPATRGGDSFPGTSDKTSFTPDTKPGLVTWSGERINVPVTDISETADGLITFGVCKLNGINDIKVDDGLKVDGGEVIIAGAPGEMVCITDITGRIIINTSVPPSGSISAAINSAGIYIVNVGGESRKIRI